MPSLNRLGRNKRIKHTHPQNLSDKKTVHFVELCESKEVHFFMCLKQTETKGLDITFHKPIEQGSRL